MKKNNSGFGLVGTLVISLGTLTMAMGAYKISSMSLNTTMIENTEFAESSLKTTVSRFLSNTEICKRNLKPAELADKQSKTGELTDGALETLTTGSFQEGLIEVVSMKLNPPLPTDTGDKRFYLYYKYNSPALGDKQKRIPDPNVKCESGKNGTPPKVQGCYYISCEMDYECTDDDCNDLNEPCRVSNNCGFQASTTQTSNSISCQDADHLLTGIKNTPECENLPFQSSIFDSVQPHEGLTGLSRDDVGNIQPSTIVLSKACPPGQYPVKKDGVFVCQIVCTGRSVLVGDRCQCRISDGTPKYSKGDCISCSEYLTGSIWNTTEKDCKCQGGKIPQNNQCLCPSDKPHVYAGRCISCQGGSYWSINKCKCRETGKRWVYSSNGRNKCKCPSDRPHYYANKCNNKCPEGQHSYMRECITCPPRSWWANSKCNCPQGKYWDYVPPGVPFSKNECRCPYLHHFYTQGNRCIRCNVVEKGGSSWDNNTERCRCDWNDLEWHYLGNGRNECKCPSDRPHFIYNVFVDGRYRNCHKCPEGQHFHNGGCKNCTRDYFYNNRCNVCPFNRRYTVFGSCRQCPRNRYHHHSGQCNHCPSDRQNYYDNLCWKCPENYLRYGNDCVRCPRTAPHYRDGKCCPSAQGACCMPGYHRNSRGYCEKNGLQCWEGTHRSNAQQNFCCRNGYYPTNGTCCPDGYFYTNGSCCPSGYYHPPGSNICCENNTVFSNGSCCPSGYTFDRDSQTCRRN